MKKNLLIFLIVTFLGVILGTIGTISFPIGTNITYFWPAAAIQTVAGIFFGFWGVAASVFFPLISNALTDGGVAHIIGFIPANIIQAALPRFFMNKFRISTSLATSRDITFFIFICAVLPHFLGSILGSSVLYYWGEVRNLHEFWQIMFVWWMGNIPCSMLFGFLMVKILTPVLHDADLLYEGYFR